ncbi:MAG: DEAD/DEAH box helicase [Thermoplasmata archaeon]
MLDLSVDPRIVEALEDLGIRELTEPQVQAVPLIQRGRNVLLIAPTGIGKTEAVLIPILDSILKERPPRISCLYITPLRALNRDMLRRMAFFGEFLGLDVAVRHGDTSQAERTRQSRSPSDILITTPETLQILFTGSRLREHLRQVRWVVVDEVHELAGDERGAQLAVALERLFRLTGREFQRIGLSATVGSPEEVARFLGGLDRDVDVVDVRAVEQMEFRVELPEVLPADEELAERLRIRPQQATALRRARELFESHRSTLFFVNTRDTAEFLSSRYRFWEEIPVGVHHGSLSKDGRVQAEEDFKAERLKALICTSSLELGIDVGSADLVLQYNSPREVTRLVQRVGRSGHGVGRVSRGVVVASNEEDLAEAAAIARRGLEALLEEYRVRECPLNVLANQVVAHLLTEGRGDAKEFYRLVRRSYPFRNLQWDTYEAVLQQLSDLRVIRLRGSSFYRAFGSLPYFYENISMIPDEKSYRVQDVSSRRYVGTLDEAFVAGQVHLGSTFIMRGHSWEVIDIGEDVVMVQPIQELGGIPNWVGEEIPVPFEVAQEVGKLRKEGSLESYPVDECGKEAFAAYIQRQSPQPVPTDDLLTVEEEQEMVVVNAAFGSKVNETLGHLLSALLSARLGQSVGLRTDPYRILLKVHRAVGAADVAELLEGMDPESVEAVLRLSLRNSSLMRWTFIQVAKKFGAVKRGVDYREVNISKVMKAFEGTPLMEEAMEKLIWEHLDIPRTIQVVRDIRSGETKLVVGPLSHIGKLGAERALELLLPPRPDFHTLNLVKKRLEDQQVVLLCLSCKASRSERVGELDQKVSCPYCDSVMQAVLRPWERELSRLLRKEDLASEEKRALKRLYTKASLVMAHGRKAVMALVARGVGPDVAGRILRRYHREEKDFLRDVLEAEVNYARTKRFWD